MKERNRVVKLPNSRHWEGEYFRHPTLVPTVASLVSILTFTLFKIARMVEKRNNEQNKGNLPTNRAPEFINSSFPSVTVPRRHMSPPRHRAH